MDSNSKVDSAKVCFAQVYCKTLLPKMCGRRMKAFITSLCPEETDVTYRTVIYADGTLILNEKSTDIESNMAKHGEAKFVYEPMLEDGSNYVFDYENLPYWCREEESRRWVTSIEVGSTMRPVSTAYWFMDMDEVVDVDLTGLRTHLVTDMSHMFNGCGVESDEPLDLTMLDVRNVESFKSTFAHSGFGSINFTGWDTSSAVDMRDMFSRCSTKHLDLTDFDTENVVNMAGMFNGADELETVDVSSFDTSNCEYMLRMFGGCTSLESLDITNFDTRKVTSFEDMFYGCETLTELDMTHFRTDSAVDLGSMFDSCRNLKSLDLHTFNTHKVWRMAYMFSECESLESVDTSSFTSDSLEDATRMFYGCVSLTSVDLSQFRDTAEDESFYCGGMFSNCTDLETIYVTDFAYDPDKWREEAVDEDDTEWQMFHNCHSLVGGNGTAYDSAHQNSDYAHLDGGTSNPGYFSAVSRGEVYVDVTGTAYVCWGGGTGVRDIVIQASADELDMYLEQGMTVKAHDMLDRTETDYDSFENATVTKVGELTYHLKPVWWTSSGVSCYAEDSTSRPVGDLSCIY